MTDDRRITMSVSGWRRLRTTMVAAGWTENDKLDALLNGRGGDERLTLAKDWDWWCLAVDMIGKADPKLAYRITLQAAMPPPREATKVDPKDLEACREENALMDAETT